MSSDLVEVTHIEFFASVGQLDVTPRVIGKWGTPEYGSDWMTPYGELKGRSVDSCRHDGTPDRYFVVPSLKSSTSAKANS